MPYKFKSYQESLRFFKQRSYKSNEYYTKFFTKKFRNSFNTCTQEGLVLRTFEYPNTQMGCVVVKKEAIDRFHPNTIDNKSFWNKPFSLYY